MSPSTPWGALCGAAILAYPLPQEPGAGPGALSAHPPEAAAPPGEVAQPLLASPYFQPILTPCTQPYSRHTGF